MAFHSPKSGWMRMTADNMWTLPSTAEQIAGTWTQFQVRQPNPLLNPGAIIALFCPQHKRFLGMGKSDMTASAVRGKNNFPDTWSFAKFKVVDGGFGLVALQLGT